MRNNSQLLLTSTELGAASVHSGVSQGAGAGGGHGGPASGKIPTRWELDSREQGSSASRVRAGGGHAGDADVVSQMFSNDQPHHVGGGDELATNESGKLYETGLETVSLSHNASAVLLA